MNSSTQKRIKKNGFEYHKEGSRSSSIIFQEDIDELMKTAYKALDFVEVKEKTEMNDQRPVLNIQVNQDRRILSIAHQKVEQTEERIHV